MMTRGLKGDPGILLDDGTQPPGELDLILSDFDHLRGKRGSLGPWGALPLPAQAIKSDLMGYASEVQVTYPQPLEPFNGGAVSYSIPTPFKSGVKQQMLKSTIRIYDYFPQHLKLLTKRDRKILTD